MRYIYGKALSVAKRVFRQAYLPSGMEKPNLLAQGRGAGLPATQPSGAEG